MDTYILQDFSLELETEKKNVVHSTDTKHLGDKQNTQHRDPGKIGHTRQRTKTNKTDRIDNTETLVTLDT
jgi:hypothetical protein